MFADLMHRLRSLIRRRIVEQDLDDELGLHLERLVGRHIADGLPHDEAVRRARLEFGGLDQVKEDYRDALGTRVVDEVIRDLRVAVRSLRATPTVTLVATLSLALGIGANTAIFSLVDSLLLRALPVAAPQQLVTALNGSSGATWEQIRQRAGLFGGALAWSGQRFEISGQSGEAAPLDGLYVSGEFFSTLGVRPILGRALVAADDVRGGGAEGPAAVISYGLWQRGYAGAPAVLGQSLVLEHVPFTIVGVTPPQFFGVEVGRTFDVIVPLGVEPLVRGKDSRTDKRSFGWLSVMLRLKPDQSIDSATATLRGVQPQIRAGSMPDAPPQFQRQFLREPFVLRPAVLGTSSLREQYSRPLITVFVIVALVLLIACANVANLLLAQTAARRHELSLRMALGASRWRLARQWFVESLLLATMATAAGYLVAFWGSRLLIAQLSTPGRSVFLDVSLDWRVMTFTVVIAVATALLFGTAPALRAAGADPFDALKTHGAGASGETRTSVSGWLVSAQVALSLVLVVGAGLFVRTFEHLATRPLGFEAGRVLVVNVNAARAHVGGDDLVAFYQRLVDTVAAVPGVAKAAGSGLIPLGGNVSVDIVNLPGDTPSFQLFDRGVPNPRTVGLHNVTPGWLSVYGTPLHAGRDIDEGDTKNSPAVVLVNEAFVRKFFPGRNPIGATFSGVSQTQKTIVGVVGDAVYVSLREGVQPTIYAPLTQWGILPTPLGFNISVRTSTDAPASLSRSIASALMRVDGDLTLGFRPLADRVDASLVQERLLAMLSGFFGLLALLLAALGLYGVTAYAVSRRRLEIGIRLALGSTQTAVVRLVFIRAAIVVGFGILAGVAVSLWASRFVRTLLYGLDAHDAPTLAAAVVALGAVAAIAALVPAWRASRIEPATILRAE
jgi:putative ABC transport system permease protein